MLPITKLNELLRLFTSMRNLQVKFSSIAIVPFSLNVFLYSSDPVELVCLNAEQTKKALTTVPDWTYVPNSVTGDAIKRSFVFTDFQEAFLFMSGSAQLAEKNQHHPDWHNLWNTVDVTLTTDDKPCLSTFDIELAQGMDQLFKTYKK